MDNKVYAPVMVTTICRYEKFRKCVESLSRCTDADKTELFIGVDYPANESHWEGYNQIREYLPSISGFKKVNIFIRDENWGQGKNGRDLRNRIKERYDRYIVTEDDNEFSPNFLQYMNQCLERYKDDARVTRICGYSYMEWEEMEEYPFNAFPMKGYCAWGVGCWIKKEEELFNFSKAKDIIFNKDVVKSLFKEKLYVTVHRLLFRWNNSAGDLRIVCYCALNDKYCIFPSKSKVRNNGFDGEGMHCTTINTFAKQEIDSDIRFTLDDFEIKEHKQIKKMHDIHYAGSWWFGPLVKIEYWFWRKTGKSTANSKFIRWIKNQRVKYLLND